MLKVQAAQGDITQWDGDAIVVNLFQDVTNPAGATGAVDEALDGAITDLIATGDLTGEAGKHAVLYARGALPATRVIVVGLGAADGFDLEGVRRAAGTAARALKALKVRKAATIAHGAGIGGLDPAACARAVTEATHSALYEFRRKGEPEDEEDGDTSDEEEEVQLDTLTVLARDDDAVRAIQAGVAAGDAVGRSQVFARDVASVSGSEAIPANLAERIRDEAEQAGLDVHVLDQEAIEHERMYAFLSVNQGSSHDARFVILDHHPADATRTICLVGKGVTFDTGGISIKPSANMQDMRFDKGGAAAVTGALLAAARLDVPVRVIGLMPFTDNMPGGNAYKPGDVIRSRSGLTIDVHNTDAEGRLLLADALDYAKQYNADMTIDLATLTGACVIALGSQASAVMGKDQGIIDALVEAGRRSHERVWPLPFYEEYDEQLEGEVGDVKNVGGRPAGSITAGKFLGNFAPDRWAHLDIAGTAWNKEKPHFNAAYTPKGATGVGVRLLIDLIENL